MIEDDLHTRMLFIYRKIKFQIPTGIRFENIYNIQYCEAIDNYTYVYLENGERMMISETLGKVHENLNKHLFFRVHKSYLINLLHVKEIRNLKNELKIITDNGSEIPIARRRKKQFINAMINFSKA